MTSNGGKAGRALAGTAVFIAFLIVVALVRHATHHCAAGTIPGTPRWCR